MAIRCQADRDGPADPTTGSGYDGDSLVDDSPSDNVKETARYLRAEIVLGEVRL